MPQSLSLVNGQLFIIPEKVAQLDIQMWGAGGGGEDVADDFTKTSGKDGGNTELLGLVAYGGKGGATPGGGTAGTGSSVFDWSLLGVTVNTYTGTNGSIPSSGNGAQINSTRYGNGAAGDPGTTVYSSSVTHSFNNTTNEHTFFQNSPDLTVNFENATAADGLSCSPSYSSKYYGIRFKTPFVDQFYQITIDSVCQNAAGGGSATPYSSGGILGKTSSGFDIWFCNGNSKNTYVACFSFTCTGIKAGAQGMGGGGGGAVSASFTRSNLVDSVTYAPGTQHTAVVGAGGTGYGSGGVGRINIQMLIVPTVNLTVNGEISETSIIIGQCVDLEWNTTGDGDTINWISGNINNLNLTSKQTVCPDETTTYSVQASGDGGLSDIASVKVIVYYVPTSAITMPIQINYGEKLFVSYETKYADKSIKITPNYYYIDGSLFVGEPIIIDPAKSAESGKPDTDTVVSSEQLEIPVEWNTIGPKTVELLLEVEGSGGTSTSVDSTEIIIDIQPENLNISETDGKFKDEDPVFTPDITPDKTILSDLYKINDIDIPVEIKSDYPIEVDINKSGTWKKVREL